MGFDDTKKLTLAYERPVFGTPQDVAESAATPLPSDPTSGGAVVVCAGCGRENPAGADQCAGATCRRVLPGNSLSRRTGLYAPATTPESQAIEDAGQALVEQSIKDAGGRDELSALELADRHYRGVLHVQILKLAYALRTQGDFDKRRRLRKGWIELLERLISSAVSLDKTLGLQRRTKSVQSVADILKEYAERDQDRARADKQ